MIYAIIVAAGKGIRMSDSVRKQYIALDGMPMLSRTLGVFNRCDLIDRIIVAVPEDDIDFCRHEIIPAANMKKEPILVIGGARRQDSVYSSLKTIETDDGKTRKLGVITLPDFYADFQATSSGEKDARRASTDVRRLVNELVLQGIDGLILDLRNNGGGSLVEAIETAGLFISS